MRKRAIESKSALFALVMAGVIGLSGCGGGSTSPLAPTLSGTAASGAPIAKNTKVYVKDANGKTATGSIVDTAGNYSVDATGLTPPIALCIDTTTASTPCSSGLDDKVLMAVTNSIGTANITPLTKLAAAAAAGVADPADLYNNPGTTLKGLSSGQIAKGQQSIIAVMSDYLKAAGIDPALFNPLTTPFIANSKGFDSVLDKVKPTLGANGAVSIAFPGTSQGPVAIPDIRTPFASYSSSVKNGMRSAWPAIATSITPPSGVPTIIPGSVTIPAGFAFPPNAVLPSDVTIASGVTLPTGITIPAGVMLPPGISIPTGAILDSKLVLPAGVVIPSGVTMPSGITIPNTATLPSSWQTAPPTGITLPPGVTFTGPPVSGGGSGGATSGFTWTENGNATVQTATTASFNAGYNTLMVPNAFEINLSGSTAATYALNANNVITYTKTNPFFIPTTGSVIITSNTNGKISGTFTGAGAATGGITSVSGTFTDVTVTGTPAVAGGNGVALTASINGQVAIADSITTQQIGTITNLIWGDTSKVQLTVIHTFDAAYETLQIGIQAGIGAPTSTMYWPSVQGKCSLSGTPAQTMPTCSSLGVTFNKSAGSVAFLSTPMGPYVNSQTVGATVSTLTGTLHFTAY